VKHVNILCGQNVDLLSVTAVCKCNYLSILKG